MRIRIRLTDSSRQAVAARLHFAYQNGQLRLGKRIHALLAIVAGESVLEVAEQLYLGEQTVRDYVCAFIRHGVDSLSYQRPSGRPPRLTKTQRQELADLIEAGPEAAGYTSACWTTPVICDLILTRFGVEYMRYTHVSDAKIRVCGLGAPARPRRRPGFRRDEGRPARHQWAATVPR